MKTLICLCFVSALIVASLVDASVYRKRHDAAYEKTNEGPSKYDDNEEKSYDYMSEEELDALIVDIGKRLAELEKALDELAAMDPDELEEAFHMMFSKKTAALKERALRKRQAWYARVCHLMCSCLFAKPQSCLLLIEIYQI